MTRLDDRTILQIIPSLDAGGAEQTTLDVSGAIVAAGGKSLVASRGGRLVDALTRRGGTFIPFPAESKNPLVMAANVARLVRLCRTEKVDLIHARSRAPAWSALAAARLLGLPFVTTYHGLYRDSPGPKRFYNSVMARGDTVIANSDFTASTIRAQHHVPADRLVVIPRGTDFSERFNPADVEPERVSALRAGWSVASEEKIILLPGRLTRWKGQGVLIQAAALLKDALPDLVFVFAGDAQGRDDYSAELFDTAQKFGVIDRIRMPGHVTDMPAALLASTAVVSASTDPEAFGRIAVEAQGMGSPTIVTAIGATGETVLAPAETPEDQRTGWRIPPDNPVALATAIVQVLALDENARKKLAERARAHAVRRFSLEAMTGATLGVYARLLPP